MTDKYCPRSEIKKLKVEMWNLKVKEYILKYRYKIEYMSVCLPDMIHGKFGCLKGLLGQYARAIEMATELSGERKEYAGTLPLCNKCKFHHNGQCTVKCANCKKVGHLTRDCRSLVATNNQRNPTCYECGNQGHYRSDCLELKNQNHGNQVEGTGASGVVHALGGGETNQDLNNMEDDINPRSRDTPLVTLGQFAIKLARQKSNADVRRKPLEFQVGDRAMLKVGPVAYKLELPQELSRVQNTFHVSNLEKCYSDDPLDVPLDELDIEDKLYFIEEPVKIMDREVKQLKRSHIPIVKVRWNSKRGPEFT
ncbi:putative reverse transcriptase domain-containing protein [Tanacetum coccineum]